MCGIYGINTKSVSWCNADVLHELIKRLAILSESRGKEAAGLAMLSGQDIVLYKAPIPASQLLKSDIFKTSFLPPAQNGNVQTIIGHSRLVTDGHEQNNLNNQPVARDDLVCVHNGIVVNVQRLWQLYPRFVKRSELDSEIIPPLLRCHFSETGSLRFAVQKIFQEIYGMTSVGVLFCDYANLLLATNNGSLYYMCSKDRNVFIFASECFILRRLIGDLRLEEHFNPENITHLPANNSLLVNLVSGELEQRGFQEGKEFEHLQALRACRSIRDLSQEPVRSEKGPRFFEIYRAEFSEFENYAAECGRQIARLKRCAKCILPETFPLIQFDSEGVCNFCASHQKLAVNGEAELERTIAPFRRSDGKPDCLVAISGGRDSSFMLHFLKKVLNLNPLTYSYDWGMITDLARRNQSRLCGKLGVEHILVSADIRKKRANIRRNVLAWLHRPSLGMIPLFMAGDKQYFYHAGKIKKQNDIQLVIMGENPFEKTGFKTAFSGAKQSRTGFMAYHISLRNKLRMVMFYASQYLANPRYINSSILNTVGAFFSYYGLAHDYLNIYDYIRWDEKQIVDLLISEYDWETEPDYPSTWRIGDGTAPFYNYIYYTVAGFTENDTFRSNQIREDMRSREAALSQIQLENQPRWKPIKWYCDVIGIDFEYAIRTINAMPRLY